MTEATTPGMNRSSSGSSEVKDELAGDAKRLKDTARDRVEQAADSQKQQATKVARSTSSALDKAAGELRNDDSAPSWLTSAFEKTAREIDSLASGIEGKDVQEIRRNVSQFARQSPTAFLAASAAAGFAAARFLRAGSEYQSHHQYDQDRSRDFAATTGGQQLGGTYAGSGATQSAGAYAGTASTSTGTNSWNSESSLIVDERRGTTI